MISLRIFGTTRGLEIRAEGPIFEYEEHDNLIRLPDSIKPDHELSYLSRRKFGNDIITWIGIYKPAFEIDYNRTGGFFGAGLLMKNECYEIIPILSLLDKLLDDVAAQIQTEGKFTRKLSEYDPKDLLTDNAAIAIIKTPIEKKGLSVNSKSVFFNDQKERNKILNWALKSENSSLFSEIIVGDPRAIKSNEKNIFQLNSLSDVSEFLISYYKSISTASNNRTINESPKADTIKKRSPLKDDNVSTEPNIRKNNNENQSNLSVLTHDHHSNPIQQNPDTHALHPIRRSVAFISLASIILLIILSLLYVIYEINYINIKFDEVEKKIAQEIEDTIERLNHRKKTNKQDRLEDQTYLANGILIFDTYQKMIQSMVTQDKIKVSKSNSKRLKYINQGR